MRRALDIAGIVLIAAAVCVVIFGVAFFAGYGVMAYVQLGMID